MATLFPVEGAMVSAQFRLQISVSRSQADRLIALMATGLSQKARRHLGSQGR